MDPVDQEDDTAGQGTRDEPLAPALTQGAALPALVVSVIAGVSTLGLVWRRRYEPARYTAAVAVTATIAGWAVAQSPVFLRGLTILQQCVLPLAAEIRSS